MNKKYEKVYLAIKQNDNGDVVEIAVVDQSGSLLLSTAPDSLQNVVEVLNSSDTVVVQEARFARRIIGVGVDVNMVCLESMASKMGFYAEWVGMKALCWYTVSMDTDHIPEDAAGDAERTRLLHTYLIKEQARRDKVTEARYKREHRKMALVPKQNIKDYPYFGQSNRPAGYKTMSQLHMCDLTHYEFAGACCDTYGNLGYLFKPK